MVKGYQTMLLVTITQFPDDKRSNQTLKKSADHGTMAVIIQPLRDGNYVTW